MPLNFGFELDQISKFMLLLLCYVNSLGEVVPKYYLLRCLFLFQRGVSSVHYSFSRINLTARLHTIHVHYHSRYSIAKIAYMVDLESKRKLSYYSNFETRSLSDLEPLESIFGPVPINPVDVEPSIIKENWPRFCIISDVNFAVNSPRVPHILSIVNVKPTGVIKLFCDHLNLTWDHVNNIPSRPLTNNTKGPHYVITRNFASSLQADMDFRHCLSPHCFNDQVVTSCMRLLIKGPWFTCAHTESGGGASYFFRFIKQRNQNLVCFYFMSWYTLLRTLLSLPRRFYRINAAWSP